jgi:predicted small lipoprotein YifL
MRKFAIPVSICAFGLLAACGQKGPLVLPDAQHHKPTTANPAIPLTTAPATAAPAAPAAGAGAQSKDDKPPGAASTP